LGAQLVARRLLAPEAFALFLSTGDPGPARPGRSPTLADSGTRRGFSPEPDPRAATKPGTARFGPAPPPLDPTRPLTPAPPPSSDTWKARSASHASSGS